MASFHNLDGLERHAVTVLDDHDAAREPLTEYILDGQSHGGSGFAAADDVNVSKLIEVVVTIAEMKAAGLDREKSLDRFLRIGGLEPGRIDIPRMRAQFCQGHDNDDFYPRRNPLASQ